MAIFVAHMQLPSVYFSDLGRQRYEPVWQYQEKLLQQNLQVKKAFPDADPHTRSTVHHLLFVEHNPVYTLGKSGLMEHVLISDEERIARDIEFFRINRGGDITFHGPGQLVGYPILDLEKIKTDIGVYLRNLEEVIIRTMAHYGLAGERSAGETGVWLDAQVPGRERKICAMGVRTSRWITMHGWAFNVNTDLRYFDHIVPCGIANKAVTSLQQELGKVIDMDEVKQLVLQAFAQVFGVQMQTAELNPLEVLG